MLLADICRLTCHACCDDTVDSCFPDGYASPSQRESWCSDEYADDGTCDKSCQLCPAPPPPAVALSHTRVRPSCADRSVNCANLAAQYGCTMDITPVIGETTRDLCPATCRVLRCAPVSCPDRRLECPSSVKAGLPCNRITSSGFTVAQECPLSCGQCSPP